MTPFISFFKMDGPKPIEKPLTLIPWRMAAKKCPVSWKKIRSPRTAIEARIFIVVYYSIHSGVIFSFPK